MRKGANMGNLRVAIPKPVKIPLVAEHKAAIVNSKAESDYHAKLLMEPNENLDELLFGKKHPISLHVNALRLVLNSYWPFDSCFPFRCAVYPMADNLYRDSDTEHDPAAAPTNPTVFIPVALPETQNRPRSNGLAIWFVSNRKMHNQVGNHVVFRNWIGNGYDCYIVNSFHQAVRICLNHVELWAKSCNHSELVRLRNRPELEYGLYETKPIGDGVVAQRLAELGVKTVVNTAGGETLRLRNMTHRAKELKSIVDIPQRPDDYRDNEHFYVVGG
jgi:hypothetical protein